MIILMPYPKFPKKTNQTFISEHKLKFFKCNIRVSHKVYTSDF